MKKLNTIEQKLLDSWEEVYKRGLLSLWILVALREQPRHAADIITFIEQSGNGTLSIEEQSMYRSLRRFVESEMITYSEGPSVRGPDRKIYELTPIGRNVLSHFINRNIENVFYTADNKKTLTKKDKDNE